jgi:Zn-dependent metalloprotease
MTRARTAAACILPPHILERITGRGEPEQRAAAVRTLATDASFRAIRAQHALERAQGGMLSTADAAAGGRPTRTIFDCGHTEDPAGAREVRAEGDEKPTGDLVVDEAYDGLGATYKFYWDVFRRNSIDGSGLPLKGYVNYGESYDNAFWDGQQMVFGDGDGTYFGRFTQCLDIIGHELTHGVTENDARLVYYRQSGALNESLSDVFGSLVKQYARGETADQADWLIGAGLLAIAPRQALRSLKAPGTAYDHPVLGRDQQPAHMRGYVNTTTDNGAVHLNSGIPNHAFYLVATKLGGSAWETAGHVWYEAVRDPLMNPVASFRTFARTTLRAAQRLGHRSRSREYQAVGEAWAEVGVSTEVGA